MTKSDSGLITLGKTLNSMSNESRKNRHPCLISDFRSKAISFCPIQYNGGGGYSFFFVCYETFVTLRYAGVG